MARTVARLFTGLLVAAFPFLAVGLAGAEDDRGPTMGLTTTLSTEAAAGSGAPGLAASPGAARSRMTQNAAGPSPALDARLAQNASLGLGGGQRADRTLGRSAGAVPTADILRLAMMQQADLRFQNPGGPSLEAGLLQRATFQGPGTLEDLRARQTIQSRVDDGQVQLRGRQVLRARLDGAAASADQVQAALRQQASIQGTAPGTDLTARQRMRVRTQGDDLIIRMVQEIRLRARQLDQAAAQPGGETRTTRAVASAFGTSEARIRAERAEHRLGLGELTIARALARATAESSRPMRLRQVIALREQEGGWGQVFHRLKAEGLVNEKNLGHVVRHARAAARATGTVTPAASTARAEAAARAAGGEGARARAEARAQVRAPGATTAEARARAVARPGDGAAARARAQVTTAANGTAGGPPQMGRTRAEVRDSAGHRFTDVRAHRTGPGALEVRVRAPEAPRARPMAITTAGNRTDVVAAGMGGGRAPRGSHGARAPATSPARPLAITTGSGHAFSPGVAGAGHRAVSNAVTPAVPARGGAAALAITTGANGPMAGGRGVLVSAGHGKGKHGHGGGRPR